MLSLYVLAGYSGQFEISYIRVSSRASVRKIVSDDQLRQSVLGMRIQSPVTANSLLGLFKNVHAGSFTEAEVQVLLLTNAVTNSSSWPVAFHTALGFKQGIDPADIQAIRERQIPKQKRFAALSGKTKKFGKRPWAQSTPAWHRAFTTWRDSTKPKADKGKLNPSLNVRCLAG